MNEKMTSRQRVKHALDFQQPDRIPRDLVILPPVMMSQPDQVSEVLAKWPLDIELPDFTYGQGNQRGTRNEVGVYYDEWGCPFSVAQPGLKGEVKEPIISDWSALEDLDIPYSFLDDADLSRVGSQSESSDRFILAKTHARPFERLQFLRGTENVFLDIGDESTELLHLLRIIHDFNLREIEMWAQTKVDAIFFQDDWGSQENMLISPKQWREIFKPLYKDYAEIIRNAGKFVFFHSDGRITKIIPDLIEIGVNALNSQLFCMDIESLAESFRGEITIWGEIDRQWILPFGDEREVRAAVRRVRDAFDDGHGGLITWLEWNDDVPRSNIEAAFSEWEKHSEK